MGNNDILKRVNITIDSLWSLAVKELKDEFKKTGNYSLIGRKCGVSAGQAQKWINGQGAENPQLESFLKIYYGLDIGIPKLLFSINPGRYRVMSCLVKLSSEEMDTLSALSNQELEKLRRLILAYASTPDCPKKDTPVYINMK